MPQANTISAPRQLAVIDPLDNEDPSTARQESSPTLDLEKAVMKRLTKTRRTQLFRNRLGKKHVGVIESLYAIAFSSWLNVFILSTPLAWAAHFAKHPQWPHSLTFALCFLALVPHERLLDYCGDQMSCYLGKQLGDLVEITLNNAIEATLAVFLLLRCQLRLLQSTLIGVVLLHLLLIPGTAFITGGARILEQDLQHQLVQLNHTLLTIGVMCLLLPAAYFAALDRGAVTAVAVGGIINDTTRDVVLKLSRGLAIVLLAVYICSRIFLHNPPGKDNALGRHPSDPSTPVEEHGVKRDPEVNQYVCMVVIVISVVVMAVTVQWLVESIEFIREQGHIRDEWFGVILLPIISFAADGFVAMWAFVRYVTRNVFHQRMPPATMAKALGIDLSIQFTLFWIPFIILLGWWTNKPISLLFDFFEIAMLLGACFIVNYVTADGKTNWIEGFAMVAFYIMIALSTWFYPGQPEIRLLLACNESVDEAVAKAVVGVVGAG